MPWLVNNEAKVLASAEVACSRAERRKGLLGRTEMEGALVLEPCRWVHTIGMSMAIDVAYVDRDGVVLKTVQMRPYRIGFPVRHAHRVIEAPAGAFARWPLYVGDIVNVRDGESTESNSPSGSR